MALAAVIGRVENPAAGLSVIDAIGDGEAAMVRAAVERYQPFHAARAELASRPDVREYLLNRAEALAPGPEQKAVDNA